MNWDFGGGIQVDDRPRPEHLKILDLPADGVVVAEARDEEPDDFEDFDEEDFDDDFDDDFEEEADEEYEAENEEYPDDDFGTGPDLDEGLEGVEIDGDIEGDFEEGAPAADPEVEPEAGAEEATPDE